MTLASLEYIKKVYNISKSLNEFCDSVQRLIKNA